VSVVPNGIDLHDEQAVGLVPGSGLLEEMDGRFESIVDHRRCRGATHGRSIDVSAV
jgi:hypothetical protein